MNEGKLCVSVIGDTAEDLFARLRKAEPIADVVELRLDKLDPENIRILFESLNSEKQLLLTMRPKEEGGLSPKNLNDRTAFWMEYAIHRLIDHSKIWIDHEHDMIPQRDFMFWVDQCFVIRSRHYLEGKIANLDKAYDTVVSKKEVGKIAVFANDVTATIGIWKLLERANREAKRMIPIAMGEAGKWTRILGPAYGAFMTYASLDDQNETAPGQITAREMIDVFRVRELNTETSVYGVIGGKTDYSLSPWMQNAAFKAAGMNSVFVPLQTNDLEGFFKRMVRPETREINVNFAGFSVTNPHKVAVMGLLDEVDETASAIGAVNTVKVEDGRLIGCNTDADGFIISLKAAAGDLGGARVALFGAGGAARACIYALRKEGAEVTVFARNETSGPALAEEFGARYEPAAGDRRMADEFDIVVNATPLGTLGPRSKFTPLTAPKLEGLRTVYDLVYNPAETRLMNEAKQAGVPAVGGLGMLIEQGARQFEIWTGTSAPKDAMRQAVEDRLKQ
ncbi:MAG: shikimate dehydrogenase [Chloracidobacterium sp.]|nr:shikimate dehydrogenase [Chloracidobacterium sp.]